MFRSNEIESSVHGKINKRNVEITQKLSSNIKKEEM